MTADEFNECVDLYADNLYRFILKNIRDKDKAKDVVQETYEKLWLKVSDVPSTNAKSYMFTTAYRTMIDMLRRNKKEMRMEEAEFDNTLSHRKQYSDLKEVLDQALSKLPDIQRMVVMMRDYEGYSYKEIGDITNLTESQVKVYIFRARIFLKNYIGDIEAVL
jgi:RNA polymerase sigma factor (sigma-70 family)